MDVQYTEEALFVGIALVIICKGFCDHSEFVQSKLRYGSRVLSKTLELGVNGAVWAQISAQLPKAISRMAFSINRKG